MRHHHTKAAQFELFGLSDQANTGTTPAWQKLPAQTRQKITGLMARLLVEHGQEQAANRMREECCYLDHPQVEIAGLCALQVLLAEVADAGHVDPQITSTTLDLSADLASRDQNQGNVHAPSSHKGSPVRAVRSIGPSQHRDDAGMAKAAGTDASEDHRSDGKIAGGTRSRASGKPYARRVLLGPDLGEG